MRRNLGNQPRIDSFKRAIDRRINNKFRIEDKRAQLKIALEREARGK